MYTRWCKHITHVLRQLHSLPVQRNIEFKLVILVDKALNGLSVWMTASLPLLSPAVDFIPLTSLRVGFQEFAQVWAWAADQSFTVAGLHLWNNLPLHQRDYELALVELCRSLKRPLFCQGLPHLLTVVFKAHYKSPFTLHYNCCFLSEVVK